MTDPSDAPTQVVPAADPPPRRSRLGRWGGPLAVGVMLLAALATYLSPGLFDGVWRLDGIDYMMLHGRRVDFAVEQIRQHGAVPAWYPRELLGTPFWSNLQSFPLLPTRLILLPTGRDNLFTLAVYLSVALSSVATYLYARRLGAGRVGAAAAGWTFVCGGYFASRTAAGQLGMLETYWALPLLLYLVERVASAATGKARAGWLAGLGLTCGALAASAHPQHPVYAVAMAGAYVLLRYRPWRLAATALAAMVAGVGCFAAQLVPMAKLIARSSRTLPLDEPINDIVMPYARLWTMIHPWADGAPPPLAAKGGIAAFAGYPYAAYFWDTVNFLGWLPLAAVVAVLAWWAWRPSVGRNRRRDAGRLHPGVWFVAAAGVAALFLALPVAKQVLPASPFIILRSPARLMYVVNFALSLALAGGVTLLLHRWRAIPRGRAVVVAAAALLLAGHAAQVVWHARTFVRAGSPPALDEDFAGRVAEAVADGRVGMDKGIPIAINRRIDDVGFFDSIMLANVYRSLIDLNPAWPERLNVQELDGGQMSARALRTAGVRLLLTQVNRPNEQPVGEANTIKAYGFPDAAPRAAYFPASLARYETAEATRRLLRDRTVDLRSMLVVPPEAKASVPTTPPATPATQPARPARLKWDRPRADRMELSFDAPEAGFVRMLESYDLGWRATVNGRPAPVYPAHNMVLAVPVGAGANAVVLEFFTPGASAGLAGSAIGLAALAGLCWWTARPR